MFNKRTDKDERAISIENSSYSIAYNILNYALLLDVIYRSTVLKQSSWDLVGIVIFGGLAAGLYQIKYKAASRSMIISTIVAIISGIALAVFQVFLNR